ncbi:MAG: hypothetical protein U1D55_08940 [Phycisphaerae bacterium]
MQLANRPDPYCGHCGYSLVGLTDSSKCPECGKPIVEVLQRDVSLPQGRRYKSKTAILGLPLVCVAIGPSGRERIGRAIGIIAVGDVAIGWVAIGGALSVGAIALGGLAVGVLALGGCAIGMMALAGLAVGGVTLGGMSLGLIASGGGAVGHIAQGGGVWGHYARGGEASGTHVISAGRTPDPAAVALFDQLAWLLGDTPAKMWMPAAWFVVALIVLGAFMALLLWSAHRHSKGRTAGRADSPTGP